MSDQISPKSGSRMWARYVVHALEPLHRHPVEAGVVVAVVIVEWPRVLFVAHHVTAALAGRDERSVDVAPVRVELGRGESRPCGGAGTSA